MGQGGTGLHGQGIAREVREPEGQGGIDIGDPALITGRGGAVDEVDGQLIKAGGPGPFQGPSSYPQLCWWSLIGTANDVTETCHEIIQIYLLNCVDSRSSKYQRI